MPNYVIYNPTHNTYFNVSAEEYCYLRCQSSFLIKPDLKAPIFYEVGPFDYDKQVGNSAFDFIDSMLHKKTGLSGYRIIEHIDIIKEYHTQNLKFEVLRENFFLRLIAFVQANPSGNFFMYLVENKRTHTCNPTSGHVRPG